MGKAGVRGNAVRPRAGTRLVISDQMREAAKRGGGMQGLDMFEKSNPPDAVAPMVVWLCTDDAANVNGRDFLVAGNHIALYSLPEPIANIKIEGTWDLDTVAKMAPEELVKDLTNQFLPKEAYASRIFVAEGG